MKKKYILPLLFMTLASLTACGQKKEASPSSPKKTSTSSQITSTAVAQTSESEKSQIMTTEEELTEEAKTDTKSTDANYNGSYYSVQGKYGDEIIIVNKKHPLAADYAPGEDPTAQASFLKLVAAMQLAGLNVSNNYSGFRSYETQTGLYNNYVASDGQANADRYSARPGYSEHQTGLAFDLMDSSGQLLHESSSVTWLAQNAHQYGFIVRYTEGKENITGYMTETWHIRYIGKEAVDIYQSGQTLEEYFDLPGGGYE